ncbi:MAG: phytanoyl-CoA dioxygenase family protein, partial [Alphaproteobacteria bacterium]|nr:phytanoyl-CoA dioxygenase family protein [Alphaproteobacteria bacterium]
MTPEQILSHPAKFLTQKQREFYFEQGYLLLERVVADEWVDRLRATTREMVEQSRSVTRSDAKWDLEAGHSAARPRLRRLSAPCDHHPGYWDYVSTSVV